VDSAARPRLDDRHACVRAERTSGHPDRQPAGIALFSPIYADPVRPPNAARFLLLDQHATEFYRNWNRVADDTVALLRAEAGRRPYDRRLPT
jgi:hypothetical protein